MSAESLPIVLGSRSPRRRELLALLVGEQRMSVRPPLDADEPALDGARDLDELKEQLTLLARRKSDDVLAQLRTDGALAGIAAVLTADTVIVGHHADGRLAVLGQPPVTDAWQATVREWFELFYFGKTHLALTAVCIIGSKNERIERIVQTEVQFHADGRRWLDWYLTTKESLGKAGGYALQGAGSLFVERIIGSPSNVIGLPLEETAELLQTLGLELACSRS